MNDAVTAARCYRNYAFALLHTGQKARFHWWMDMARREIRLWRIGLESIDYQEG